VQPTNALAGAGASVGSSQLFQAWFSALITALANGPTAGARQWIGSQFGNSRAGQVGMGGGLLGKVLTIVVVPMLLIIGLIVYANFESSVDTGMLSTDAQTAINTTNTNAYNGFDLAAVLPIVIAGVAVLGIVISAFVFDLGRA